MDSTYIYHFCIVFAIISHISIAALSSEFAFVGQFGCSGRNEAGSEWGLTLDTCKQKCISNACISIEFFPDRNGNTLCQTSTSCKINMALQDPWSPENQQTYGAMNFYVRIPYYDGGDTFANNVYTYYQGRYCEQRNDDITTDITLTQCMNKCNSKGPIECISFEYSAWNKRCSLSYSCTNNIAKNQATNPQAGDIDIYQRHKKVKRDESYYVGDYWEIWIDTAYIGRQPETMTLGFYPQGEIDPYIRVSYYNINRVKIGECATGYTPNKDYTVAIREACWPRISPSVMYRTNAMKFELWDNDIIDVADLFGVEGNDYITTFYKHDGIGSIIGFCPDGTEIIAGTSAKTISVPLNGGTSKYTLKDNDGYWVTFEISHHTN